MKADYDSKADAVLIEVEPASQWDDEIGVDGDHLCGVGIAGNRPVAVTLRYPAKHLDLLDEAAKRFGLDGMALLATVQASLAAPDHEVTVDVNPTSLANSEAEAA
jgi:uncharacterized protein YuzE